MNGKYGNGPTTPQDYEKVYAVWTSDALGAGNMQFKTLIEKYESFEAIYKLGEAQYIECGIKRGSVPMRRLLNKSLDNAIKVFDFCTHYFFGILLYTSEHYPKRLKGISNPPPVLYVRGKWVDFNSNVCIAVVGTRSYSEQGWKSTYMISEGLARCGAVVVTGLASGIDTAATSASLAAGGMTVGVLGTGIERIYPSENKPLFERMYENGTLITELSPFSSTSGAYFPTRNRIISGLCHGVLVGEGAESSGAMITAAHAAEQGRHIFAIPGDISNSESSGVNKLINEGATPVFDAWNILEKYYYAYPHRITRLERANGSYVPSERSSRRIRVTKGKKPTAVPKEIPIPQPTPIETPALVEEVLAGLEKAEARATEASESVSARLESLGEAYVRIYELIPKSGSISLDAVLARLGTNPGEIIACLTELETQGIIKSNTSGFSRT